MPLVDKTATKRRFSFAKNDDGDEIAIGGPEMLELLEEVDISGLTYDEIAEGVMEALQTAGLVKIE